MKRIRPAPMGRAYRYQRRMSHIEIYLAEKNRQAEAGGGEETREARPAAKKKAPAKKAAAKKSPAKKTAKKK
jgi:large subunit ribosomal protein L22